VRNLGINVHEGMERELTHVKKRRVNAWGDKLGIKRMFKC
jgi:hypothetical protein